MLLRKSTKIICNDIDKEERKRSLGMSRKRKNFNREKRDEEMLFLVVLLITEEDGIIDDLLS